MESSDRDQFYIIGAKRGGTGFTTLKIPLTAQTGVYCINCGRAHDPKEKDFLAISGNITLGLNGGIIGPNIDSNGKVIHINTLCLECLDSFFAYLKECVLTPKLPIREKIVHKRKLRIREG